MTEPHADSYYEETPTYNLKVVVRETGLKADTLRVWERRYGLPQPQRTTGGHRLYSQRDIDILKWLVSRQKEGMSISRAVKLWRQFEAEGRDPTQLPVATRPKNQVTIDVDNGALSDFRRAWISACLAFDQASADQVLNQAFGIYSVETVCTELMQAGLAYIGQEWYKGNVSVQQEHFASALVIRRLEALLSGSPVPTRSGRILIGCPPDEEHTFSPLMLSLLLRRRGWDIVYLGARVPLARFQ
ncbi:MAG: MerR family transcriptional regulator, partial [Chloroflexota bacterium]